MVIPARVYEHLNDSDILDRAGVRYISAVELNS